MFNQQQMAEFLNYNTQ